MLEGGGSGDTRERFGCTLFCAVFGIEARLGFPPWIIVPGGGVTCTSGAARGRPIGLRSFAPLGYGATRSPMDSTIGMANDHPRCSGCGALNHLERRLPQ